MVEDQFDRQGHRRAYKGQAAVLDEAGDDGVPGGQTDLRALFRTMVAYSLPSTFSVRSLSSKPPNQICELFGSSQNHEAYPVCRRRRGSTSPGPLEAHRTIWTARL